MTKKEPKSEKSIDLDILNEYLQAADDIDVIQKQENNRIFGANIKRRRKIVRKRLGDKTYKHFFPTEKTKDD